MRVEFTEYIIKEDSKNLKANNFGWFKWAFLVISILFVCITYLIIDKVGEMGYHPTLNHPFGTDPEGRDLYRRTLQAFWVYLVPGLIAAGISIGLGTLFGLCAEGLGKGILPRSASFFSYSLMDALESLPKYMFVLLAITILEDPNFYHIIIILGILNSSKLGKIIAEKIKQFKEREFIEASEALGLSRTDIVLRHILFYNCSYLFIVQFFVQLVEVIIVEVSLSYLGKISNWGLGVTIQEPLPSYGNILIIGMDHLSNMWWISFFPLSVLVLNILLLCWVADNINKRFNPQHQIVQEG
jgi:peptide/nickel transport system permease protein